MATHLELAILAMDAYNRAGAGLNLTDRQLGRFRLDIDSGSPSALGFFAQSYTVNGETIISYRGTDDWADVPNGLQGAGHLPPQTEAAAKFYQEVTGQEASTTGVEGRANVILTGHSLGRDTARKSTASAGRSERERLM